MSLYNLPNSTSGFDNILVQTVAEVPLISPLLLLFVYTVVFLGGVGRQKARVGDADYPMWSVVASIATLMVALTLSIISGLIRLDVLIIVVVITILSFVWLAFGKGNIL